MRTVEVLFDKQSLVDRALELVLAKLRSTLEKRDRATIVLAGGSTPKPLYEALAGQDLPWDKLHVFWGDERYVPPDDPDSNQRMARLAWLDRVPIPAANIHPFPTQAGNPETDANSYETHLRQFFGLSEKDFPVFDLILLGMGDDGHTASLFPHTEAVQVCDRAVAVGNKDGQPRLTLSVPTINLAECVIFLVAGENKREALSHVFSSDPDTDAYPAAIVEPLEGELWWLLDAAAGAEVEKG